MSAEPLPRADRIAVLGAVLGAVVVAWAWLWYLALDMAAMAGMAMSAAPKPWTAIDAALMFAMWWVMMVGMMLPGAIPMILTFATVGRRRRERGRDHVPTVVFVAGYLVVWGLFCLAATAAQWGLEQAALMSATMATTSPVLGAALFVAAGIYQVTPLKHACLRHCRSPFDFVVNRWRDGRAGAWRMGIEHGAYCLGCCWLIMLLLFVGGVMNLLWVAAITVLVLVEKVAPGGRRTAWAAGGLSIAFGGWLSAAGAA